MIDLKDKKYQPLDVLAMTDRVIVMPCGISSGTAVQINTGSEIFQAHTIEGSNLLVVGNTEEERIYGVVVAIGAELPTDETTKVQVGDVVYYNKFAAHDIEIKGRTYQHMRNTSVLAVLITEEEIKIFDNRLLVVPDEAKTVTIGGIIIPEESKETPVTGTVVQVGMGVSDNIAKDILANGNRIMYHKFGGVDLVHRAGGKTQTFLAIPESEVMAIID